MTDLTPADEQVIREFLAAPTDVGPLASAGMLRAAVAALDAERARAEDAKVYADGLLRDLRQRTTACFEFKDRAEAAEAVVEAARDLCNQETDTYPALEKALTDMDYNTGGGT